MARSWTRRRRTTASRCPRIEGTLEDVHAVGYLWLNVRGGYLRQRLLAQALHTAARHPTILILAEDPWRASPEEPPLFGLHPTRKDGGRPRCVCPLRDYHPGHPALGQGGR